VFQHYLSKCFLWERLGSEYFRKAPLFFILICSFSFEELFAFFPFHISVTFSSSPDFKGSLTRSVNTLLALRASPLSLCVFSGEAMSKDDSNFLKIQVSSLSLSLPPAYSLSRRDLIFNISASLIFFTSVFFLTLLTLFCLPHFSLWVLFFSSLFQTCVLKVNIHCDGCQKKVKKLLQKIDGASFSFTLTTFVSISVQRSQRLFCFILLYTLAYTLVFKKSFRCVHHNNRCRARQGDGVRQC
jgi:copper chaperone CopZ